MVIEKPGSSDLTTAVGSAASLHKAGTTLTISSAYDVALGFTVGGTRCAVCTGLKTRLLSTSKPASSDTQKKPTRNLRRREVSICS